MASAQHIDGGGSEPTIEISEDELFDVLSNQRRRFAVHLLKREGESLEIGDMAEQIAAWENGIETAEITGSDRKRVYTALQQSHLPKMDRVGVIEFNKNRGVIDPTPALEDVDLYLDVVEKKEIPWSEYYLGLTSVSMALVAAVWVGAWPFVMLPEVAWMLAIVVAFAFSSLMHKYYTAEMKVGEAEEPPELQ